MDYKDYYKTLGVDKKATADQIKAAYRKLARKYHPDVNQSDPSAEEKFKDINEAYQVLSDSEKRSKYDQFGSQWQQYRSAGGRPEDFNWSQWASQSQGQAGGYRTVSQEEFSQMFGGGLGGFSDFFETLFGGMGGLGGFGRGTNTRTTQQRAQPQRMANVEHEVQITLEEAYNGTARTLQFEDGHKIEARIPPGVRTGSKIRLSGQAGGAGNVRAGDLYLKVQVLPHSTFTREKDDLRITLPIDLYTAVLGGEINVPTMGKSVRLTIPEGTDGGKTFRLKEMGMPVLKDPSQHGNLLVTVEVQVPKHLTQVEKEKFKELKHMRR